MELRISARHFELEPEVKEYAKEKIMQLKKFFPDRKNKEEKFIDASLVLTLEKHRHRAELYLSIPGKKMFTKSETKDIYASIDEVSHKMERMIRDYLDKLNHHKKSVSKEMKRKEFVGEEEI